MNDNKGIFDLCTDRLAAILLLEAYLKESNDLESIKECTRALDKLMDNTKSLDESIEFIATLPIIN